jgi:hypothetical protein
MVEKEKSIEELVAELDSIATIPEVFEQPKKEEPKEEKPKPKFPEMPNVTQPVIPPVIKPAEIVPLPEEPTVPLPPPPPQPNIELHRPSLDGLITKAIDRKKQQIDEEKEREKQQYENKFYDGLLALVESIASSSVNPAPILTQQVFQQLPSANVKDNSEAITLIDAQLIDPATKDKLSLLKVKRQLQGKPFTEEEVKAFSPVSQSTNDVNSKDIKLKRRSDWKIGLALFTVVTLVSLLVLLGLHL